jgi:citrate lyase subunit beta / citryl-CoA lyase
MSHAAHVPLQSFLFVPATRPERFAKALDAGADAVIVDLEDAVALADKATARATLHASASAARPVLVRINGADTPWFDEDLALAAIEGVAGIVVPKAESARDIVRVMERNSRNVPVFPLVETAAGMVNVREIAKSPGVRQLMFGTLDFLVDIGAEGDGVELDPYRAELVLASRVANIDAPVDGVTPEIGDLERLRASTLSGKARGMGGKLCIHPAQVPVVTACFMPTKEQFAWASSVLDAARAANGAAVAVDGKMVDRPVILRAERIVRIVQHYRRSPRESAKP